MDERSHSRRPQNREEVHDARQRAALADLEELSRVNGVVGNAEGALARHRYLMKDGAEVDYAGLSRGWNAWIVRLPIIILCALIFGGLAIKYL